MNASSSYVQYTTPLAYSTPTGVGTLVDKSIDCNNTHLITCALYRLYAGNSQSSGSGQAFVYQVSREGTSTVNPSINVYANAFGIYGLANYAQATGSSEALNRALEVFKTLDTLYHSPATGSYDESATVGGLTFDSIALQGTSSSGQQLKSQAFNTLLHAVEALTELTRATGGSNPTVTARLLELVKLLTGPLVVRHSSNPTQAYIASSYDPRTWTPVGEGDVSYGHNIEAAWLVGDVVDELRSRGAIDSATATKMKSIMQEVGASAVQFGYDTTYGGFYEGGAVGSGGVPSSSNKVFWIQAEAVLGLDWLFRQTGQQQYSDQLQGVLGFVRQYVVDRQYGEWYWQVPGAGGGPLGYFAGGVQFSAGVKGNWWKASYHVGRALLALESRGY